MKFEEYLECFTFACSSPLLVAISQAPSVMKEYKFGGKP
jgi:hypothetical protein